ncbi:hypothetical protein CRI94_03270 [Longibacter salinarum]|uniref:DUF4230 domain-containing protein n=1 Tax=Longibacter salinarum TaxID=1850348 RepID=A0A2A8D2X4_9BACT|nr:DUF4230 domain-containing protein [Longibacter salinarum]PEN15312.1 hypothetical protein CRI94_03270 [Longibacter salinarum]
MTSTQRGAILGGIVAGALIAAVFVWWLRGPSEATVRRTVVTTVQSETPASVLVTGKLHMSATIDIDSTSFMTPSWMTSMLQITQPELLPYTTGTASVRVRIPGTVSYGFNVKDLTSEMIAVEDRRVTVQVPELSVQSVEPDLRQLEVRTSSSGWMKMFTTDMQEEVQRDALARVEATFRRQANAQLASSTQPKINTARALRSMLTPALESAGVANPSFQFRVGDDFVLTPTGPPESESVPRGEGDGR